MKTQIRPFMTLLLIFVWIFSLSCIFAVETILPPDALAQDVVYKGDLNGNDELDLADAILGLQVISRMNPEGVRPDYPASGADVGGDGQIGLDETIYILQVLAVRNTAPTAEAGPDQDALVGDTAQLDGAGSFDAEANPLAFQWSFASLPDFSEATFSDPSASQPTFFVDRPGIYVVQLVVNDGKVDSDPDTVTIASQLLPEQDADGDTWADFLDCAPEDPEIHPAALEICGDEIDNDCSGAVDDKDTDDDGFIDLACGGDDVNDENPDIRPNALEICNDGIDNNSNLLTDLDDPACQVGCDVDGDGYPSADCGGPDADDRQASVYPGAPEVCDDFIDNDLDGEVDEGCHPGGVKFGPPNVVMLASDSHLFHVLDDLHRGIMWEFSVEGAAGGNETVGTIESMGEALARYTAPAPLNQSIQVELRATDPNDTATYAATTVTVHPLIGDYVIKPTTATVGLRRKERFLAGIDIENVGFVPIKNVVWRVNGNINEDPQGGTIDTDGLYRAPDKLPDPLPYNIQVGFSLGTNTEMLAAASVLAAKLDITPKEFFGLQPGPVGNLTGTVIYSNNTQNPAVAANMDFFPSRPRIATVDANGSVSIGQLTGQSMLQAVHLPTGARDFSVAHSISDISLKVIPLQLSADFMDKPDGQGGVELEFTRAGGVFQILPMVSVLRGQRKGEQTAGEIQNRVTYKAAGANIQEINTLEDLPDMSTLTAAVDPELGIVFMGEEPGVGTIDVTYKETYGADLVVQHTVPVVVRFSRLEMDVTVTGTISGAAEDFFVTELIKVDLALSNPSGSGFIGDSPIGIKLEGDEPFLINFGTDYYSGVGAKYYPMNGFQETRNFQLTAGSTENEAQAGPPAEISFKLSPKRDGAHKFLITLAHDPGAPPQELLINVKRPKLGICPCSAGSPIDLQAEGAFIPVNNWAAVRAVDEGSVFDLYNLGTWLSDSNNDLPVWRFVDTSGVTTEIPVATSMGIVDGVDDPSSVARPYITSATTERLTMNLSETGNYYVYQHLKDRPEMRTETLAIPVLGPDSAGAYFPLIASLELTPVPDEDDGEIPPRSNTLGYLHIQEVSGGAWEPGKPIQLKIQTYDAEGTAKVIGKTVREDYEHENGEVYSSNWYHRVMGVSLETISGPYFSIEGTLYPDTSGLITATITPNTNNPPFGKDLILRIKASEKYLQQEDFPLDVLPGEHIAHRNEVTTFRTLAPTGIAVYENPDHNVLTQQCHLLEGRLVAVQPRQLPVASQKVRDAVAEGKIPPGYDQIRFRVRGAKAFTDALGSGIAGADLGPGISLVESSVEEGVLHVTAGTDISYFEVEDDYERQERYGDRTLKFITNDGREWQAEVSMFGFALVKPSGHAIKDVPLNGDHEDQHAVGSQVFFTNTRAWDPTPRRLDLEIVPSLMPETLLGEAISEENEMVTFRHNKGWIMTEFRGAPVEQPLIGFRREEFADFDTHQRRWAVSDLKMIDFERMQNAVTFFGDPTDNRRLDRRTKQLGPMGDPDLLPDFVSPAVDAELMVMTLGGNMIDLIFFTAFNIMAEPQGDLHPYDQNPLDFDVIGYNANREYRNKYRDSKQPSTQQVVSEETGDTVVVHVDREADVQDIEYGMPPYVPKAYWGGILDQYFIMEEKYSASQQRWVGSPLGQDGRVGGYDDEGGRNSCKASPTGRTRKCFGIELDGALYDPNIGPLDKDPNSLGLLDIPIVANHLGNPTDLEGALTANRLVPDIGGTSGGYYVIDKDYPGAGFTLAKTPGQDFPGLHAGYLVQNKGGAGGDDELLDEYDDIEDVLIHRNPRRFEDMADGQPIADDHPAWPHRRLMGFATDFDRKEPVTTSLQTRRKHKVVTDPAGMGPFKIEGAALYVAERPRDPRDRIDLMVTTQSDGWEGYLKAILDATTDLIVDLAADVVLGALTDGAWIAQCGGASVAGAVENVGFAILNAVVGVSDQYLADEGFRSRGQFLVLCNDLAQNGTSVGGLPVSFNFKSIAGQFRGYRQAKDFFDGAREYPHHLRYATVRNIGICPLLKSPLTALKGKIRNSLTVSELGGNGAAQAFATKAVVVTIPPEARKTEGQGQFTKAFTITNMIELLPKTEEQDFDLQSSAEMSDLLAIESLINTLHGASEEAAKDAKKALDQMILTSVKRERFSAGNSSYENYKLKIGMLPLLAGTIVPGEDVGEFILTADETEITVASSAIVGAIRTNQNATARAALKTEGYDLIILGGSIPSPHSPP